MYKTVKTVPFQVPWIIIGVRRFPERMYEKPNSNPKAVNWGVSRGEKWTNPKAIEDNTTARGVGINFAKDGNRNPLNTVSSKRGARIAVVVNKQAKVV